MGKFLQIFPHLISPHLSRRWLVDSDEEAEPEKIAMENFYLIFYSFHCDRWLVSYHPQFLYLQQFSSVVSVLISWNELGWEQSDGDIIKTGKKKNKNKK